ncbi:putative D,D-dipeptide transport ATP-binding protein DdpF [subsurface metagenome]
MDLQEDFGYGFLFITHNLSVINHIANRVAVMYLGRFVELGDVDQIFNNPGHPYTKALLAARSEIDPEQKIKRIILEGDVPSPINPPKGCFFNPRCTSECRTDDCELNSPIKFEIEVGHFVWCHLQNNK